MGGSGCSVGCGRAGRVRRSLAIRLFASKQFPRESVGCVIVGSATGAEYTESRV